MAFLASIGLISALILISIPLSILNGAVLMKLWEWFLIPLGLPALGLAHAIGIALIISYTSKSSKTDAKDEEMGKSIIFSIIRPLFALVFGYVVKSFM